LYRWQWHLDGSPRVPNTARRSSQLASLAGTIVTTALEHVTHVWYNQSTQLVQPVLLSDRIQAELRAQILSGALPPGAAVPSERRLAEQLGAGRHAVREALKRLQEAGLIRISHGGATRVRDWRHDGGLDLLLALAAQGDVPPELEAERAALELRACVGADAARRAAERASAAQRAEITARAEALAAATTPETRNVEYERMWDVVVDGAGNIAYRLALNTLVAGQHVLVLDADRVGAELDDDGAIRKLARAIADGRRDEARAIAAELLERSVA
jgi:GntR family transcriptional regulator, transcriptional repressor for pyruvate dehydrogenase complex